jgi:methylenetetrahydrofolate dehydrogenase (NADP+) / methenyltetrahydrofolate cyclohydrolase
VKTLNGSELAGFIKERQAKAVRGLRQAGGITPKLSIVQIKDDPVINTYVRLKKKYGSELGIEAEVHRAGQTEAEETIKKLNEDSSVHGIILQLPIDDVSQTERLCNLVSPHKDVDALGKDAEFEPATPMAILWLLAGYNVDLNGKNILLIGRGKLVGAPLEKIFKAAEHEVTVADRQTKNLKELTLKADIIITAAGSPAILFPDMLKEGSVVVDAGVASEDGRTVGDVSPEVYDREDLTITPQKGGVGPLTVCALFENVILAARRAGDV